MDPHRCHWWSHSTNGWTGLQRGVDIGSHHALPLKTGWLYDGATTRIKLTYAYRVQQVWLDPQEVGDAPMATLLCRLGPPLQNHKEGRQPNGQEKTPQWNGLGPKSDFLVKEQEQVKVVPKSLTRMLRAIQSPSPSPPRSSPAGEWLCLYMRDLKLQSRTWVSRSTVWQSRSPTPVEDKLKKQVRFNIDDKLGSEPTLPPPGMTLFLAKGETVKWPNTLISATTGPTDSP